MTGDPVTLSYTIWRLAELGGAQVVAIDEERGPHLVLDLEESRVAGSGGVNRIMGTFVLAEDELRFGPLASTRMAGPEEAMEQERAFLERSRRSRRTTSPAAR